MLGVCFRGGDTLHIPAHKKERTPHRSTMPWNVDLALHGYNKGYYTTRIRELNATLVANPDTEFLEHILAASNVKFQTFVQSIRRVVEEMFPCINNETTLSFEEKCNLHELLGNTNWASHGPKSTGKKNNWPHTTVDEAHCDRMVELFDSFVDISLAYDDYENDDGGDADELTNAFAQMALPDLPKGWRYCTRCSESFKTKFKGDNPVCRPCM